MTRLFERFVQVRSFLQLRQRSFASFFPSAALALLSGLLGGSLVGTFLDFPRAAGWWDGALILALVFAAETTTWFTLQNRKVPTVVGTVGTVGRPKKTLSFFKRGALFAFFVDAFKVGSLQRKERDSNPREPITIRPVFETGAFNLSAIFPSSRRGSSVGAVGKVSTEESQTQGSLTQLLPIR